jgi:hypothetical protein
MGKIERDNASTFTSEQLEDILQCLHYFLSFSLGRWAGLGFPIGYDDAGEIVFEQWGLPLVSSGLGKGSGSWFDEHHGDFLAKVFPGFFRLWQDQTWHKPLRDILYWYLAANERGTGIGVDAGLILAQTSLELLSWTYCVQYRGMVSPEAFQQRGLSSPDKLRLLASVLDIPLELPTFLSTLFKHISRYKDSMGAISTIRNGLVHPDKNDKQLPTLEYYEAWKLSLWIIDLALLHLCDYAGEYANRLKDERSVGTVETVPWAQPPTEPQ